jgi:tetratricopeptide (TPR) repeat protein
MSKEAAIHQRVGQLTTALRIVAYASRLAVGSSSEASSVRSRLSVRRSFVHHLRSRHTEALHWSAIAVEEARASGDPADLAYAYNARDLTLTAAGVVSEEKFGELALASYELSGDLDGQAKCLINLGIRAFQQGEWLLAAERYAEAGRRCQRVGDTDNEAIARYNLAELMIRQRRYDEAEPLLPEAQRLARVADDVELLALIARETGKVRVGQGRATEARACFEAAREGLAKAGLDHELMDVGAGLAECRALEGDIAGGVAEVDEVLLEALRLGDRSALGALHFLRGALLMRECRWAGAELAFTDGCAAPDPGDGGCTNALNRLGLARAREARLQTRPDDPDDGVESLRRLGVVIPTL